MTARAILARILVRLEKLSPRAILLVAWIGMMLYAYPGFMSYDSVFQLNEARSGVLSDGHPPAMSVLWGYLDMIVAGPLLMLVLQTVLFLSGTYLLFARYMKRRTAAICAGLVLWFPPVSTVMAVIWKDSIMAGFLVLGAALLPAERRWVRLLGLVSLAAATAMRHNALAMTFPLVLFGFAWSPSHRWWLRFPIALVAWVAITMAAQRTNAAMTDKPTNMWPRSLALLDIVNTLRHSPPMTDAELGPILEGMPLRVHANYHAATTRPLNPNLGHIDGIWTITHQFVSPPEDPVASQAVTRAWKTIVPSHIPGYLAYRWGVFTRLVQLADPPDGSAAYIWYTDVFDPLGSARKLGHNGSPSAVQAEMRIVLGWFGTTWMFRPYLYLILALLLLPFCLRDRHLFGLVASGLSGEAGLFILAPTIDYRYSFWLIVATVLGVFALVAARAKIRAGDSP